MRHHSKEKVLNQIGLIKTIISFTYICLDNGNTTEIVEAVASVEPVVEAVGSMEIGVVEAVGTTAVPEDSTPASSSKCEACDVAALNYQQIESSYILVNNRLSQSNAMLREQCRAKDRRIENARMKEQVHPGYYFYKRNLS